MTTTRWLDEQEQRTWRLYQAASMFLEATLDRQLRDDAGMPHAYFVILARLSASPDRSRRMTSLAQATSTSQSRMSHAIAALEKYGWVRREKCSDDSRGTMAVLTDAGMRALETAAPGHVQQVRADVFDRLSPKQVEQLGDICETILLGTDHDRSGDGQGD